MILQQLKEQFEKVFTKDFEVKACGRKEVIKLIELANTYDDSKCYGNLDNGFMYKDNIIDLYKKVML